MPDPATPQLRYPVRIMAGEFSLVEQDSPADIDGCVQAIARCPQGHLDSLPDFGLPDYTLTRGAPDAAKIRAAITRYEPGADLIVDSRLAALVADVTITERAQA